MKLIDLVREWLDENGYKYRLSEFWEGHAVVMDNVAHSFIKNDRITIGSHTMLLVSDPLFFQKYKSSLDTRTIHPPSPDGYYVVRICVNCSITPYHPHPSDVSVPKMAMVYAEMGRDFTGQIECQT